MGSEMCIRDSTRRPRGIKTRFPGFFTFFRGVYFPLTGNTKASDLKGDQSFLSFVNVFKADRLQMIVVAKKYICVATVYQ